MKINFKQSFCAFIALFTFVTAGSLFAKDKTAGEKVDRAIEKTKETAEAAKEKAKEGVDKAKESAHDAKEDAKEKAHKGLDKL